MFDKFVPTATTLFLASTAAMLSAAEPKKDAPKSQLDPQHAKRMAAGLKVFKSHVRPVLVSSCLDCHGGDETEADFDLSDRKRLLRGGEKGPVVIPGRGKDSKLYKLAAHLQEPHMPQFEDKLPAAQLAHLARWIDLGAPYDKPLIEKKESDERAWITKQIAPRRRDFWSFQQLAQVTPPNVADSKHVRNDIDRFIVAKLQEKGLQPAPAASRRTLIRRAYFDLIGLPPKPEEVDAFVADDSPDAYEKLIDRLLDSPHYGERWARHWLDAARFAESHGFEQDYNRPHAYHYRNFVIQSLNRDMPYDRFVRWQLAGDELAPENPLAMTATGFLGAGAFPTQLTEKEFESARYDELDDMVATIGTSMLGLTIGCARCHDHKYDPLPQADYYRMISAFTTTIRTHQKLEIVDPQTGKAKEVTALISSEGVKPLKHHADGRGFPHFYKQTHFLRRGDVNQKVAVASLGFPQALTRGGVDVDHWRVDPPEGSKLSYRRAALARWITDTQYGAGHLLARVIVNRVWHHHFDRGLVRTINDFGAQGERPTHPQLLDWLARRLIDDDWRLKPIHRLIMQSAAYRQSSQMNAANRGIDPENRFRWRFEPQRLEAEIIRDAMLAVSGELDRRMFGPGTLHEGMKRRSIYFMVKRSKLIPMMQLFDQPEPLVSAAARPTTTIAPQALLFMNNRHVRGWARSFARETFNGAGRKIQPAVRAAYRAALSRLPSDSELAQATDFIAAQQKAYEAAKKTDPAELAMADFCQVLFALNEFVYVE